MIKYFSFNISMQACLTGKCLAELEQDDLTLLFQGSGRSGVFGTLHPKPPGPLERSAEMSTSPFWAAKSCVPSATKLVYPIRP